ncbi:MAG TPA: M28 family peptidase, partial [Gemmatimonadaceae bacterium]|nr:M28 family peptidase [Gemmatimonadaceae bacterium]
MTKSIRIAIFTAVCVSSSAFAQQALTPSEGGVAPTWDVLLRGRTHTPTSTTSAITASDLQTRLYIFADDSMQGRLLATAGNVKGVEYIASEVKRLGLTPMGDNGSYFQSLNMVERKFDSTSSFAADGAPFTAWTDYLLRDQGSAARKMNGAQVVFGGTWGDSTSLIDPAAAAGKVVVLRFSPAGGSQGAPGGVDRARVTRYFASAAGIAIASFDLFPKQFIQLYQRPSQLIRDGVDPDRPSFMYVTKKVASTLLKADIDSVKAGATGVTISSTPVFTESPLQYPARNVVAMIPGSDPVLKNQYVAIGAHNDHIGWSIRPVAHDSIYIVNHLYRTGGAEDRPPQLTAEQEAHVNTLLADIRRRSNGASARPDSIYNGADDDGSGSVSALEIAEYFAGQKTKPKRSLLFVWHVGEEEGLYGSEWYTDHPTVARDSIVAQLNMDMIGRGSAADNTGITAAGQRYNGNPNYL